jgi:hypothetical protein
MFLSGESHMGYLLGDMEHIVFSTKPNQSLRATHLRSCMKTPFLITSLIKQFSMSKWMFLILYGIEVLLWPCPPI